MARLFYTSIDIQNRNMEIPLDPLLLEPIILREEQYTVSLGIQLGFI